MESAFVDSSKETIFAETLEYFANMLAVKFCVVAVDEDVIKIDNYANIEHISKDVVHESWESGWRVCESEGHDLPFKQSIAGSECSLPFITFGNVD